MCSPDSLDGTFAAYDARTLQELWSYNVGAGIDAPAITYAVNGKQYVAVLVGAPQRAAIIREIPELKDRPLTHMLYVFGQRSSLVPHSAVRSRDKQTAAKLGRLRGEMDAIEQASIRRNCIIQFQRAPGPATADNARNLTARAWPAASTRQAGEHPRRSHAADP